MKPLAFLSLGLLLLICIGCSASSAGETGAQVGQKPKSESKETPEEKAYREAFVDISAQFAAIKKSEPGGDPEAFLTKLKENHEKERHIISSLADLKAPPKFKDFHETMVAWKKDRWALDEEGIDYLSNKESDKVDELSVRIDQVGESYRQKIDEIVRAHGYNSAEQFLGIR